MSLEARELLFDDDLAHRNDLVALLLCRTPEYTLLNSFSWRLI